MHLSIVSPYPPATTGIGQHGYHVSRMLAQSGLFSQITILTGRSDHLPPIQAPPPIEIEAGWDPEQVDAGWSVVSQLEKIKPDLVWFNLGASAFGRSPLANVSGFFSPLRVRQLGIPTVVMLHELVELADLRGLNAPGGPFARCGARLITWFAQQSDVVCLTMRRYVDWLSARNPDLRCVYIPIGAYRRPELLEENPSRELLFFTTLAPYKGLELLLEAFRRLQGFYPDLHLTIAGAEHSRFPGYAQKLRAAYKDVANIRWLGEVPEDRIRELFLKAQIVVVPYTASTGSSSVLYQAAMWGRSLVASDLPELESVAMEGGLEVTFFHSGSVECLCQALDQQMNSPEKRRDQAEHNHLAVQRSSPEDTCRAFLNAFNLALESRSSRIRIVIPQRLSTGLS